MSKAITEECMALLKEAGEMFEETGCVPGIDGEQVPAEMIVPDAKEYISETIDDPETMYDPEIWDTPGFALVLSWLAQKWNRRCHKLAPRGSTLARRKKLPTGKSELARALVGSSSAQSYSSFPLHRRSIANAKAIPRSEEFFRKPLSNVIFELHECARS